MKIGIVFRGITTGQSPTQKKDWTLAKDNIKENLIGAFEKPIIYFTTYTHPVMADVIDFYQPRSVQFVEYAASDQRRTLWHSLNHIVDEDLDFVIIARFDMTFNQKVSEMNIDYKKFNFIFRETEPYWTQNKYVSDTFFAFPKKFTRWFMEAVQDEITQPERKYSDMHAAYKRLYPKIGNENIHFMYEGTHRSDKNDWFEIKRI